MILCLSSCHLLLEVIFRDFVLCHRGYICNLAVCQVITTVNIGMPYILHCVVGSLQVQELVFTFYTCPSIPRFGFGQMLL